MSAPDDSPQTPEAPTTWEPTEGPGSPDDKYRFKPGAERALVALIERWERRRDASGQLLPDQMAVIARNGCARELRELLES